MSETIITSIEQAQEIIGRAIAAHYAAPPAPPAPAASGPEPSKPYDPASGDPSLEQAAAMTAAEREALHALRPGWDERVAAHDTEADHRQAWEEAQAVGERKRSDAAAQAEWEQKVASDPEYRQVATAIAYGREAASRWTALTDQQRVEALGQSGLLQRQRGVVGDDLASQIARHAGFTAEQLAQGEQIASRLVPCPNPRAWGAGVVQVGDESFVLEPAQGFTPHQQEILGLISRKQHSPGASWA